jgi:hypothetical protein
MIGIIEEYEFKKLKLMVPDPWKIVRFGFVQAAAGCRRCNRFQVYSLGWKGRRRRGLQLRPLQHSCSHPKKVEL